MEMCILSISGLLSLTILNNALSNMFDNVTFRKEILPSDQCKRCLLHLRSRNSSDFSLKFMVSLSHMHCMQPLFTEIFNST